MPWSQQEGTEEPETNPSAPQQKEHPDATEGGDIADYDLDIDYDGSEHKNKPVTQEQKEKDPDMDYTKMKLPQDGNFHQRMMPWETMKGIQQLYREQWPDIMALCLQDMYI